MTELLSHLCLSPSCFAMATDRLSKPILLIRIKRATGHKASDSCHRSVNSNESLCCALVLTALLLYG